MKLRFKLVDWSAKVKPAGGGGGRGQDAETAPLSLDIAVDK